MKKLFLGSLALTVFSMSIILFQISCKKEATAQATNCSDLATIVATVNFPPTAVPCSTDGNDNGISFETPYTFGTNNTNTYYVSHSYYADFRTVGNASQKVFTFQSVVPGTYEWGAVIRKGCATPYNGVGTVLRTINVVAGQTYNVTINASDFR